MRKFNYTLAMLCLILAGSLMSCGSDDSQPTDPNEIITTVNVSFTNNGMTDEVITGFFRDIDGPGGENPFISDIQLSPNSSYTLDVEFLNERANPAENLTPEIIENGLDYQVFYELGGTAGLSYAYADQDAQGNPIGLRGIVTTGAAGNGTLRLTLLFEPVKSASGVANGDIGNARGEEDIRVQFNIGTR